MGTNYYLHRPACGSCHRAPEPEHICKSFTIWHGLFIWDEDGEVAPIVTSFRGWRERITNAVLTEDATIEDEYGTEMAALDFFAKAGATPAERRRVQYDWIRANQPNRLGEPAPGSDWLDGEGFSFSGSEFS